MLFSIWPVLLPQFHLAVTVTLGDASLSHPIAATLLKVYHSPLCKGEQSRQLDANQGISPVQEAKQKLLKEPFPGAICKAMVAQRFPCPIQAEPPPPRRSLLCKKEDPEPPLV